MLVILRVRELVFAPSPQVPPGGPPTALYTALGHRECTTAPRAGLDGKRAPAAGDGENEREGWVGFNYPVEGVRALHAAALDVQC